jgi:hypothetical protein
MTWEENNEKWESEGDHSNKKAVRNGNRKMMIQGKRQDFQNVQYYGKQEAEQHRHIG